MRPSFANELSKKFSVFDKIFEGFTKVFATVVLIIPGIAIIAYILYSSIQFELNTKGFIKAKVSYSEIDEADTTGKTVIYHFLDAAGKEYVINSAEIKKNSGSSSEGEFDLYDSDEGTPVFDEQRVRFDAKKPVKLYYENSWLGRAVTIVFGGIFIFFGSLIVFNINPIKKPKRIIIGFASFCLFLIGAGLLLDYIVSLDKNNPERFSYEYLAAAFILIGGTLFGYWLWTQKMWRELDTIGDTISIKNYNVVLKNKIGSWHTLDKSNEKNTTFEAEVINTSTSLPIKIEVHSDAYDWALINPYVIQCVYEGENGKKHFFETEHIWFNPTPFIKGEIKVLVHPKNAKYYKIDASFLPDVDLITGRIYTRL